MGRKREEIDVLASHYYCRANWQGHNGATVFLEEYYGGIFQRDILKDILLGYFGGQEDRGN